MPARYAGYFASDAARTALNSHRGYDPGALSVARQLAQSLCAPLIASTVTRLLIDLNRSLWHKRLSSEFCAELEVTERQRLRDTYYHPHRNQISEWVGQSIAAGQRVMHVAVHSFVPILDGEVRQTEIGLLYDPRLPWERELCQRWQQLLVGSSAFRVRRNYPYQGKTDGLTTALRKRFGGGDYLGIELELNQALSTQAHARRVLALLLSDSLRELTQVAASEVAAGAATERVSERWQ